MLTFVSNNLFLVAGSLLAGIAGVTLLKYFQTRSKQAAKRRAKEAAKNDPVLYLHVFPKSANDGMSFFDYSAFCSKLDAFLRLSNVDHKVVRSLKMSAKGKKPFLVHRGEEIADSFFCIQYVKDTFGVDIDAHLTAEQSAIAHATRIMLEERTYFIISYARWVENLDVIKRTTLADAPALVRPLVANSIQKSVNQTLHLQGLGRHTRDQIYAFGCSDLKALAALLGDKRYFFNDRPCTLDAVAFAFVAAIYFGKDFESPLYPYLVNELPNLCRYIERLHKELYSDAGSTGVDQQPSSNCFIAKSLTK